MKEVSKRGVRHIDDDWPDQVAPEDRGSLATMLAELITVKIPLPKGAHRFKSHAEMNAQWEAAMLRSVDIRQREISDFNEKRKRERNSNE